MDPIWYHAIEVGVKLGCVGDIVDIAVICSAQKPIFLRPAEYIEVADEIKRGLSPAASDHLNLASVFNRYMRARQQCLRGMLPRQTLLTGARCISWTLGL